MGLRSMTMALGVASLLVGSAASAATITTLDGSQGWGNYLEAQNGGSPSIGTLGGREALILETNGDNSKAAAGYYLPFEDTTASFGQLSDLSSIDLSWYRDSSSTVDAFNAPVLRLHLHNPGADRSDWGSQYQLVWELGEIRDGAAVTDTWVDETIDFASLDPRDAFWIRTDGTNFNGADAGPYLFDLEDWSNGQQVTFNSLTSSQLLAGAEITGIQVAFGSGIGEYFLGGVDNVELNFSTPGNVPASFAFDVTATNPIPEPATAALGLMGLGGLLLASRRRRSC